MKAAKIEENEELFDVTEECSDDDRNMTLDEFVERDSELERNYNVAIEKGNEVVFYSKDCDKVVDSKHAELCILVILLFFFFLTEVVST